MQLEGIRFINCQINPGKGADGKGAGFDHNNRTNRKYRFDPLVVWLPKHQSTATEEPAARVIRGQQEMTFNNLTRSQEGAIQ